MRENKIEVYTKAMTLGGMIFLLTALVAAPAKSTAPTLPPAPGTAEAYAALPESIYCIEAETGLVLEEANPDLQRPPASMIKMILMLMVDEGVNSGMWTYDKPVTITKNAEQMGGTQVYVKTGESNSLDMLMCAVAVASANDAAMAVAEGLWGSRDNYLIAANKRAQELGMKNSVFYSVHGLPPAAGQTFDLTSARDMARLGQECVKHPKILEWTSKTEMTFRASDGVKKSTNKLLESVRGCDGIKTGYIRAAGFCITASAARDGVRLIAVVMGDTKHGRFERAEEVLESCFTKVKRVQPVVAGAVIGKPVPVTHGMAPSVQIVSVNGLQAVVRNEDVDKLQLQVTAPASIEAPVAASLNIGRVQLILGDKVFAESPLVTLSTVERKGFWRRVGEGAGIL